MLLKDFAEMMEKHGNDWKLAFERCWNDENGYPEDTLVFVRGKKIGSFFDGTPIFEERAVFGCQIDDTEKQWIAFDVGKECNEAPGYYKYEPRSMHTVES